jgi:hypothetical protein
MEAQGKYSLGITAYLAVLLSYSLIAIPLLKLYQSCNAMG